MQQAFLIIIALASAVYAFLTKQGKIGLGFLVLAASFVLTFPNLVQGGWVDVFGALSLIGFLAGAIIIVWKKPVAKIEKSIETNEPDEPKTE